MKSYYALIFCISAIGLASCASATNPPLRSTAAAYGARPLASESTIYEFPGSPNGAGPFAGLLAGAKGEFYGVTNGGGTVGPSGFTDGTVFEISASGTEKVLYTFQGGNDGAGDEAGLVSDSAGNLYGATSAGGGSSSCGDGCGVVYELQHGQGGYTERILHVFTAGRDGALPIASLLLGKNGVLYGTTNGGGTGTCSAPSEPAGCGVVFKLTPSGSTYKEKILHSFQGGMDGETPRSALIADDKGNLYGTTEFGGKIHAGCLASGSGTTSCGTVFELTPAGKETVLYRLKGGAKDGSNPRAALLPLSNGSFVAATVEGGAQNFGTVFELKPSGKGYAERVIYFFGQRSPDGARPFDSDGLVADGKGDVYGTTRASTSSCGCGAVFKLTPAGSGYTESVLHLFAGADGAFTYSGVVLSNNQLFGTTFNGGDYCSGSSTGCGVVYKVKV